MGKTNKNRNRNKTYKITGHVNKSNKNRILLGGGNDRTESVCAPDVVKTETYASGSCFSKSDLLRIIADWNTLNPKNHIAEFKSDASADILWKAINARFSSDGCKTEFCWVKKKIKSRELAEELRDKFRPEMPKHWTTNRTSWLSTIDIEDVLIQYHDIYPTFAFMGAVPIDFDHRLNNSSECVSNAVCRLNIKTQHKRGKKHIGIVFNLDEHTKSGSHWIAMFIDLDKRIIGFWDSYGFEPPNEVITLIVRLQNQAKSMWNGVPFIVMRNRKRHQYKNSECGMYCINFIVQLLEGGNIDEIYNKIILDDDMNKKRSKYFNKPI